MKSTGLRERKKLHTREAILTSALDLFERKGFDATTVEEIAEAAEISPRTFFRYFDSKVALVLDSEGSDKEEMGPRLLARPASEAPLDAIHNVLREGLGEALADRDVAVRRFSVVMTTPGLRALVVEHVRTRQTDLVRAFAARLGVGEDELAPRVLAAAVSHTIVAIIERWISGPAELDELPELIDEAFAVLRSGFNQVGSS